VQLLLAAGAHADARSDAALTPADGARNRTGRHSNVELVSTLVRAEERARARRVLHEACEGGWLRRPRAAEVEAALREAVAAGVDASDAADAEAQLHALRSAEAVDDGVGRMVLDGIGKLVAALAPAEDQRAAQTVEAQQVQVEMQPIVEVDEEAASERGADGAMAKSAAAAVAC